MPFPSEHACRIFPPGKFKRFVRMEREHDGKKYSAIIGWWKGKEGSADQAYRYNKEIWTETTAKTHCKEKKGTFEAAKKVEAEEFMKEYKFVFPIDAKQAKEHPVKIEILREGVWAHPEAPDGVLEVTKEDLEEFKSNFEAGIVGMQLPLDKEHKPEPAHALGWIKKFWLKLKDGIWHLWAGLDITDEQAQKDLKSGSLKYISPTILIEWKNPENQKLYNVIRSAALTNYPYIKNMEPAIVNFSEISQIKEEVNEMNQKELEAMEAKLKAQETELLEKGTKLEEREETLKTGEEDLTAKGEDLKQREEKLAEEKEKDPTFSAETIELATKCKAGDQEACGALVSCIMGKEKGDYVAVEKTAFEELKKDVEDLKTSKGLMQKAMDVTAEEAKTLREERDEIKATNLVDGLIRDGKIVPGQKDLLKKIVLANDESKIELEEDGKKKEVSKTEALLQFLMDAPARVQLGQKSVSVQTLIDDTKTAKDIINMTKEDLAKLSTEEREAKLKKFDDIVAKQRKRR